MKYKRLKILYFHFFSPDLCAIVDIHPVKLTCVTDPTLHCSVC